MMKSESHELFLVFKKVFFEEFKNLLSLCTHNEIAIALASTGVLYEGLYTCLQRI